MHLILAITFTVMVTGSFAAPAVSSKTAQTSNLVDSLYKAYSIYKGSKDDWKRNVRMAHLAQMAAAAKAVARDQSAYYDYSSYPYYDWYYDYDWLNANSNTLQSKLQRTANAQTRPQANSQFYNYDGYWNWKKNARTTAQSRANGICLYYDLPEDYCNQMAQIARASNSGPSKSYGLAQDYDTCLTLFSEEICQLYYSPQAQTAHNTDSAKITKSDSINAALQKAILATKPDKHEE